MRILHLIAGAKEGGAEYHMLENVLALAEAGVEQHVITRSHSDFRLERFSEAGVPYTVATFDKLLREPTKQVIRATVDSFKPDVLHHWMGRAGTYAPKRTRERNLGWYGGYYKLDRFKNCAWHAAVTSDIARSIIAQGAPADHVATLNNYTSVDPAPPVSRAEFSTPQDAPLLLALARLHWKKGLDTLLEALADLPGVYLWVAGEGPLENDLKAQAAKLGVTDRVRWLGWRTDRGALLAACDVVAFPSRYEPFGQVTIEAWAANKPLVTADAAGPAATVTNDVDALLVPKDNPKALRDALRRVIEDADLAKRLVENGARTYQANFTKTAFVRASMALYEKIRRSAAKSERASAA
ncbi:MAG: glycosyltransferase [Hyphomonadaceae bacterium]|nr:glycosyltransferase [Hyphomonadaceae bacterium]